MKKLTARQKQFLDRFIQVYQALDEPVHYVTLAGHLGIGNVTAYEMLRLLEARGLIASEYYLPELERGPGRSSVLFRPTAQAYLAVDETGSDGVADQASEPGYWEVSQAQILSQLRAGDPAEYDQLLTDLVERIPEQKSPQAYLTEMTAASLLALRGMWEAVEASGLAERLRHIGLPGEIGVSALAGVNATLAMIDRMNRSVSSFLAAQSGKYQTMLSQIGEENQRRLNTFAREVAKIINR